jgi:hypothetical protein
MSEVVAAIIVTAIVVSLLLTIVAARAIDFAHDQCDREAERIRERHQRDIDNCMETCQ